MICFNKERNLTIKLNKIKWTTKLTTLHNNFIKIIYNRKLKLSEISNNYWNEWNKTIKNIHILNNKQQQVFDFLILLRMIHKVVLEKRKN